MLDRVQNDATAGRRPPIYAHIGAMKTGTTFIQLLLEANRPELAEAGFCVPEEVRGLRRLDGVAYRPQPEDPEKRHALVEELRRHTGRASLLSWEFLSFALRDRAERVIAQLPTDELHVILTVRDAAATLPAQWQTMCRNRSRLPWARFVAGVATSLEAGNGKRGARVFHRSQDVARMLGVWVPLLGADRVHVVTVPPRGSDPLLLWRRFAEVVGVDPAVLRTTDVPRNPTLGWPSSELLRRVNVRLGEEFDIVRYHRVVRAVVARDLESRVAQEPPIRLDHRASTIAARWNAQMRDAVVAAGVPVVGSLDDLPDTARADADELAVPPDQDQLLAAAATARDSLLRLELALTDGRRRARQAPLDPTAPEHWNHRRRPLAAAVGELADRVRRCAELDPGDRKLDQLVGLRS